MAKPDTRLHESRTCGYTSIVLVGRGSGKTRERYQDNEAGASPGGVANKHINSKKSKRGMNELTDRVMDVR